MGYPIVDYNGVGGNDATFYVGQMSIKEGKRTGTFADFAEPWVGKGLTVLTFTHVTKVIFMVLISVYKLWLVNRLTFKSKGEI